MPPSPGLGWRHGSRLRDGLVIGWLALQATLILTAGQRSDRAFGFRMFNESSTLEAQLARRVEAPTGHGTVLVPVPGGTWVARDRAGEPHRFAWSDRVKEPMLSTFGVTLPASYGVDAQVTRWHAALDDVAEHLEEDTETRGLELTLTTRKNGREPEVTLLRRPPSVPPGARAMAP